MSKYKDEVDAFFGRKYNDMLKKVEMLCQRARKGVEAVELLSFAYELMLKKGDVRGENWEGYILTVCKQQLYLENSEKRRESRGNLAEMKDEGQVEDVGAEADVERGLDLKRKKDQEADESYFIVNLKEMTAEEEEERKMGIVDFLRSDKRFRILTMPGVKIADLSKQTGISAKILYKRQDKMRDFARKMYSNKSINITKYMKNWRIKPEYMGHIVKLPSGDEMDTSKIAPAEYSNWVRCGFAHCFYDANAMEEATKQAAMPEEAEKPKPEVVEPEVEDESQATEEEKPEVVEYEGDGLGDGIAGAATMTQSSGSAGNVGSEGSAGKVEETPKPKARRGRKTTQE